MALIKLTPKLMKYLGKHIEANLSEQGEHIPEINLPKFELKGILTCGACPVQYEGTIGGKHWYFRARHENWYFCIAETFDDAVRENGWCLEGEDENASWMAHRVAVDLIRKGAEKYLRRNP